MVVPINASISSFYLYLPEGLTPDHYLAQVGMFERAGYDRRHIRQGESVYQVAQTLPAHSVLVISSLSCCAGLDELIELLRTLEPRSIALHSFGEPWANEILRDTLYAVGKLRTLYQTL